MCLKRDVIDAPQSHYAEVGGEKTLGLGLVFGFFWWAQLILKQFFKFISLKYSSRSIQLLDIVSLNICQMSHGKWQIPMERTKISKAAIAYMLISLVFMAPSLFVPVLAKTNAFTAIMTPTTANANQLVTYTITITNTGVNSTVGSANVAIPTGFVVMEPVTIAVPATSWSPTLSSGTISVTASGGSTTLNPGESVVFTFAAVAPTSPGVTTWTTDAHTGAAGGGQLIGIQGSQPTVIVTLSSPLVAPTISASPFTIDQGQASTLLQLVGPSGGSLPYIYQWSESFNGGPFSLIAGADGSSYTFSTTTSTATGTWTFKLAVNDSSYVPATVSSNQVNVFVNSALSAPEVTAAPDVVTQIQPSTLTFSPVTTGTSPYVYQWFQRAPGNDYTPVGTSSPSYVFPGSMTVGTWAFLLQVTDNTGASINSTSTAVTITALPTFTITVVGSAHGIINPGTTSVIQGGSQSFTITPEAGYRVADVLVDSVSVGALTSYTFNNVNVDHSLTASFNQIEYSLTVSTVGSGSVDVSPSQSTYHYGDVAQLTATPAAGWSFSGWSGDFYRSSNPISAVINGTTSVTATFVQNTFILTVSIAGSGSVNKSPDQASYHLGDVVTLTANPFAGWSFGGWTGDFTSSSDPVSVIINGTTSVTATFVQNTYPLTVSSIGSGSVVVSPNQALYHSGDVVQLTANPSSGWSFSSWSGTFSSSLNPVSIIINGSTFATVTFVQNGYSLGVSIVGSGSVGKVPDQASYHLGDVVTLTASPATGWALSGWGGSVSGSLNPVSVIINGTTTVTATFSQNAYSLTIHTVGSGSVALNNTGPYHLGDVVRLTANPSTDWIFGGWSEGLAGSANPAELTINGNLAVTATFTENTNYLTVYALGSGSVVKAPDQATYRSGDVVQLTAIPKSGWRFAGWSGSLTGSLNPSSIVINGSIAVTATFLANQYLITASAGEGGSISPSGTAIVDFGGVQAFLITPAVGYHVADVLVNGTSVGSVSSYTVSNVTGDTVITASFAGDAVAIVSSAGPHGTINPSGTVFVSWNGTFRFTITPEAACHIENVLVDEVSVGAVDTYTFVYVTTNHTISAEFAQEALFSITVTSAHGNPPASTQVNGGDSLNVSVTSIEGDTNHRWICTGYSINGGALVPGTSYTFSNVQANHVITFNWQEQYHLAVDTQVGVASGTGWYNASTMTTVSISSDTITNNSGTRQIFTGWSGDAAGASPMSNPIMMDSPKLATANWKTQYYLTVSSTIGTTTGQGWYDEGATAAISVDAPASNTSDTRIILTWKGTDSGYTGSTVSSTVTMSRAITEEAIWTTQYQVTYKLTGNNLQADPPQTEWVNSGSKAVGAFVPTFIDTAGRIRNIFLGDDRPSAVTVPSTVTGTYKTQYLVKFDQTGLNSNVSGVVATVLGVSKAYGEFPNRAWTDQDGSVTFTYAPSVESAFGEKYVLKNVNSTSPLTINEPTTILAEYALEVQSTFDLSAFALIAVVICSLALSPVPIVAWRRRKRIITPIAGEGGYISPSTMQKIERGGSSTVFIITARYGYKIKDVVIDNKTHLGAVRTYKFADVNESHTISAMFSRS